MTYIHPCLKQLRYQKKLQVAHSIAHRAACVLVVVGWTVVCWWDRVCVQWCCWVDTRPGGQSGFRVDRVAQRASESSFYPSAATLTTPRTYKTATAFLFCWLFNKRNWWTLYQQLDSCWLKVDFWRKDCEGLMLPCMMFIHLFQPHFCIETKKCCNSRTDDVDDISWYFCEQSHL